MRKGRPEGRPFTHVTGWKRDHSPRSADTISRICASGT
jgi:hypothetical protein